MYFADHIDVDAERGDRLCRPLGRNDFKIKFGERLSELFHLLLVLIRDGKEQSPLRRDIESRADDRLVQRAGIVIIDAHDFARGLHLGSERNIDVRHLCKREYGSLYRNVWTRRNQPGMESHFLERSPHRNLRRHTDHIDVCNFRKERNGAARSRIHLDDEHLVVRDDELDVQQPLDVERDGKPLRIVDDGIDDTGGKRLRRIDSDAVARVNPRALDVFHDAGNNDVDAVGNRIDFHLRPLHVAIHEDGVIRRDLYRALHVVAQLVLIVDNLHRAAAEHIGGAHHHRIADALCPCNGILKVCDADSLGAGNPSLRQHLVEPLAILGAIDVVDRRSIDSKPRALQSGGEVDRRLPAELYDNAVRLFLIDDIQNILDRQRLKVEPVGDVKVRTDCLRIVVDDDGFDSHTAERPNGMYRAVIELHALPDADRPRAEHNDLLLMRYGDLVLGTAKGRIVVRGRGFKLGGTCVDHFVARHNVVRTAHTANLIDRLVREFRNRNVGKSGPFCRGKQLRR